MYLTLPLAQESTRPVSVIIHTANGKIPVKYTASVRSDATISDLKVYRSFVYRWCLKFALAVLANVPPTAITLCDIYGCRIFKTFSNKEGVDSITERDSIHGYLVTSEKRNFCSYVTTPTSPDSPLTTVSLLLRKKVFFPNVNIINLPSGKIYFSFVHIWMVFWKLQYLL